MMTSLDQLKHRVWDDRHTFEDSAHVLGGIGVGLLIYPSVHRSARTLGWALVGLSSLMHLYAFLTRSRGAAAATHAPATSAAVGRSGPTFGWALVRRSPQ